MVGILSRPHTQPALLVGLVALRLDGSAESSETFYRWVRCGRSSKECLIVRNELTTQSQSCIQGPELLTSGSGSNNTAVIDILLIYQSTSPKKCL